MKLSVANPGEFKALLDVLANELVDANIHYKLHRDLIDAAAEFSSELNESNAFWSLTVQAHIDAALFRLCKIYDQHGRTVNIRNMLDTVEANLSLFATNEFREREAKNTFLEELSSESRAPDLTQLQTDKAYADDSNPLVKKLVIWRNNYFAHRSKGHALGVLDLPEHYPLLFTEVQDLLRSGMKIINHYSSLYCATSYSTNIIGRDDFRYVLTCIREHRENVEKRIQEEIRRLSSPLNGA